MISLNRSLSVFCLIFAIAPTAFGQFTVNFPRERMVYQRNNSNEAQIYITGNFATEYDSIRARVLPRAVGQGTETFWKKIATRDNKPYFSGSISVEGGWYNLQIAAFKNGGLAPGGFKEIQRVGVGEVFVIAGQSNAQGGSFPGIPSTSDRVNAVGYDNDSTVYNKLPIGFNKIDQDSSSIGPFHFVPWVWGKIGEALVDSLNVPVSFYGAAHGGTNVQWWYEASQGLPLTNPAFFVRENLGAPFKALEMSMSFYASLTGVRAVLWHQGESDHNTSPSDYQFRLEGVIAKSRSIIESPTLTWMVARASLAVNTSSNPINGQNQTIAADINVLAGPATDAISGSANRTDGIHFDTFAGQIAFATSWMNFLTSSFFSSTTPVLAVPFVDVNFTCNTSSPSTPITLSSGASYSSYAWSNRENTASESKGYSHDCCTEFINFPPSNYLKPNWSFDSTSSITTVGGKYMLNVKKTSGKRLFSPIIDLSLLTLPTTPSISGSSAQVRPGESVTLTGTGCSSTYKWSNNEETNPITPVVNSNSSFTAQCKNLFCTSSNSNIVSIIASNCFASALSLTGNVIGSETPYKSKTTLQSTQIVQGTGSIDYSAKNSILLSPGFKADGGARFTSKIEDCN